MRCLWLLLLLLAWQPLRAEGKDAAPTPVRFLMIDLYLDPLGQALAAYQLEFKIQGGARIVGIEGGSHAAFSEPPFFDPQALRHERVVLASFNTSLASRLPSSKTRVATLHLQVSSPTPPKYSLTLQVAGTVSGTPIRATASFEERVPSSPITPPDSALGPTGTNTPTKDRK